MNPNILDRIITIERQSTAVDGYGEQLKTWEAIEEGECFANVTINGGAEVVRARKLYDTAEAVFIIRYRGDFTARDRINYDGKHWNIISIEELGYKDGERIVARRFGDE